jgi:hypothetical protein
MAKKENQDLLSTARNRLKMAIAAFSESREDELDDLRFFAGSPDNQYHWPADVLATRGAVQGQTINARPCLTINKLPQHVREITNDQRQNRPSGKVIPVDDKADVEVAEIFNGMVRHIEYLSDADVAYDTACENQVAYGEGYIRLLTEYCDDDSFNQDIKIGRVRNSFSVYMDPTIKTPAVRTRTGASSAKTSPKKSTSGSSPTRSRTPRSSNKVSATSRSPRGSTKTPSASRSTSTSSTKKPR